MPTTHRKKRIPQLKFTNNRKIGWHVSYRDPQSGTPTRHRFGNISREEAEVAYHQWLASYLTGQPLSARRTCTRSKLTEQLTTPEKAAPSVSTDIVSGSLLHIASGLLTYEESRVGKDNTPRRRGSISQETFRARKQFTKEFLQFLNSRYQHGAVGRMQLAELKMEDVESYNNLLVEAGYSDSQVTKRMQVVKAIIDRAGRPEHGRQLLVWNWHSRDVSHGKRAAPRILPSLAQLKLILRDCDVRRTAMVCASSCPYR